MASEVRTGFEWMDTLSDWLFKPLNITKGFVSLWGLVCMGQGVDQFKIYFDGPPDLSSPFMPLYRQGVAFCWLDRDPALGFMLSLLLLAPFLAAAVLVWIRPQISFPLALVAWCTIWPVGILHVHSAEPLLYYDWRSAAFLLGPALWLFIVSHHVQFAKMSSADEKQRENPRRLREVAARRPARRD